MTSTASVLIDIAWAAAILVLANVLIFQVRRWRRPAWAPVEEESDPAPPSEGESPLLVNVRKRFRCPLCSRPFEVLLDPAALPKTITCPGCGLVGPYRGSSKPEASSPVTSTAESVPLTSFAPTAPPLAGQGAPRIEAPAAKLAQAPGTDQNPAPPLTQGSQGGPPSKRSRDAKRAPADPPAVSAPVATRPAK